MLWWRPLLRTFSLALHDEAYTHILLIVPLSFALLYLERNLLWPALQSGTGFGVAWLAAALLLAGFERWGAASMSEDIHLSLSMLALVLWWLGSFIVGFGTRTFQSLLFPLLFLLWIVPLPGLLVDEIISSLQYESAFAARIMFRLAGVPVTQDGVILSIPSLDIEVARECSSIRSSMLLVIITMVLAHLFLRSGWRKVFFIVAAIPMAAIKNGFRIFTITELGTKVDPGYFDGNLHHRGGILFLGVALVVAGLLLWLLRRTETIN
ncbi:MAG: exosortase [Acidobacteria bacterium]|nr:exosortase [Acidobacteriota bacterium]